MVLLGMRRCSRLASMRSIAWRSSFSMSLVLNLLLPHRVPAALGMVALSGVMAASESTSEHLGPSAMGDAGYAEFGAHFDARPTPALVIFHTTHVGYRLRPANSPTAVPAGSRLLVRVGAPGSISSMCVPSSVPAKCLAYFGPGCCAVDSIDRQLPAC